MGATRISWNNKQEFLQTVILQHPNFNIALGAELYQWSESGEHQVIAFASRAIIGSECNYITTEKEMFSIIFACQKFRTYILEYPVIVRTDHQALSYFRNSKLMHGRLIRWMLMGERTL